MNETHHPVEHDRAFVIGVALNLGFVAVEAVFGVVVGFGIIVQICQQR